MDQYILKYKKTILFFLMLITIMSSCKKENNSPIPDIDVSLLINLNIVNELSVPGNSVFFPNFGYGGIIVYCELPGSFYAFDAACPHECSRSCIVKNEGVMAECPCCGSQFILLSGAYPSKGPATLPLKEYHVSTINNFTLRVYN